MAISKIVQKASLKKAVCKQLHHYSQFLKLPDGIAEFVINRNLQSLIIRSSST
ncbi:hypothetical protein [Chroococcus sp. FPU101]|uniref:hypothetical protein n=1 Tax=Chroococcus sp. FPU101 TaxID=1974212 RepID=UPI001A8FDB65|nr:hypothetical protein [Chroococcus sp. FPU101]GFE71923.1 hypothetical protein CFPU101_45330 [Chroococcus sp. FPU101]